MKQDQDQLNRLRRMAGVPQDFHAKAKPKPINEDVVPGMSAILRGGQHKFYLVQSAHKNDELGDIITEVDIQALINIIVGATQAQNWRQTMKTWELFPHDQQNKALDEARKRLATVTETVGYGASVSSPDNTPEPSQDEIRLALSDEDSDEGDSLDLSMSDDELPDDVSGDEFEFGGDSDECHCDDETDEMSMSDEDDSEFSDEEFGSDEDEFADEQEELEPDFEEPATNICPDCVGGEHPPVDGSQCERCDGVGEVFENVRSFKKGQRVKFKGQTYVVEVPNAQADMIGIVPPGHEGQKDKVNVVKISALGEASHYHTSDNYPLTHKDSNKATPHNVDAQHDTVWDKDEKQSVQQHNDYELTNDTTSVKIPGKILKELKRVIDELTAESEKAQRNNRDWESAHYYEDTAQAFQTVYDFLNTKTVQGLKQAQIYSQRMMNIQRVLMPDTVWKFIVDGGPKRSLKSYMNSVKDPVVGKPQGVVAIDKLNKNTHTE